MAGKKSNWWVLKGQVISSLVIRKLFLFGNHINFQQIVFNISPVFSPLLNRFTRLSHESYTSLHVLLHRVYFRDIHLQYLCLKVTIFKEVTHKFTCYNILIA